jgi:hypothetical protein
LQRFPWGGVGLAQPPRIPDAGTTRRKPE